MKVTLVTAPAAVPLSVAEAKSHLRVDGSDEDSLIGDLIDAATAYVEGRTGRALINQTWKVFFDSWPNPVQLPFPPLGSVTHVKTYDDSDSATTFSSSNYYVDVYDTPGRLVLRTGQSWPSAARVANGIEIQFTAGYGASASNVPEDIRQAIRLLVGHWYLNREAITAGERMEAVEIPLSVSALLTRYEVEG